VIFDAVGRSSFSRCRRALSPHGVYLTTVPTAEAILSTVLTSFSGGKKAVFAATGLRKPSEKKRDLEFLAGLIKAGSLKPVVGREYCMSEIVEAHRHVETGHKRGSLVVNIS
jgi:NADPH:quinone reductase-like Zn-dependent oxidoreductase